VVERARRARRVDLVVVATTTEAGDDPVAELCSARGYACARGSLHDVLDRYVQAARTFQADVVVRVTADCPVIDPQLIDRTLDEFARASADFAATRLPPPWQRTYPIGEDVEVVTRTALERAWAEADQPHQREHVMPYFYEGVPTGPLPAPLARLESPRGFHLLVLNHDPDYGSRRWTVDTPEDLELMRQVYARFENRDSFGWTEVLALFEREPGLAKINASVAQKSGLEAENHSTK